jgi:hypothetical protein
MFTFGADISIMHAGAVGQPSSSACQCPGHGRRVKGAFGVARDRFATHDPPTAPRDLAPTGKTGVVQASSYAARLAAHRRMIFQDACVRSHFSASVAIACATLSGGWLVDQTEAR